MFQSSGYFRSINCPFFASGLCDRPNCQFRHVEESTSLALQYTPTAIRPKPQSMLDLIGNATKQLSRTVTYNTPQANSAPQYIPTPIPVLEQLKRQKTINIESYHGLTFADVADFNAEVLQKTSDLALRTDGAGGSSELSSSVCKRKFDEIADRNGEPPSKPKKAKSNNDVSASRSESSAQEDRVLQQNSNEKSKKKERVNLKEEKLKVTEKRVKNDDVVNAGRDGKKNGVKKEGLEKSGQEGGKIRNKSHQPAKESKVKSPVKCATETKPRKPLSPPVVNKTKKSADDKTSVEIKERKSERSVSDERNAVVRAKAKSDGFSKARDDSEKSNLASLKIAESRELEMALFGGAVPGRPAANKTSTLQRSKPEGDQKSDTKKTKEDRISNSSKVVSKVQVPSKHHHKARDGLEAAATRHSSSVDKKFNAERPCPGGNKVRVDRTKDAFSSEDLEPPGDEDEEDAADDDDDDGDDDDDDDVTSRMKECYKLFMQSSKIQKTTSEKPPSVPGPPKPSVAPEVYGKKRIAHPSANKTNHCPKKPNKLMKDHRQVMLERLTEARQKLTIEAVMDDQLKIQSKDNFHAVSMKGSRRVAHVPSKEVLKRPVLTYKVDSSLVPVNFRLDCFNKIIDKCLEIYDTEEDAYTRSLEEEKVLMTNCAGRTIYRSRFVTLMLRLNRETASNKQVNSNCLDNGPRTARSINEVLHGKNLREGNFTLSRCGRINPPPLTVTEMHRRLQAYLLDFEQLKLNGFPHRDPETRTVVVTPHSRYTTSYSSDANHKHCSRCGRAFVILNNGNYLSKEDCMYHWGPCWKKRVAGSIDYQYNCCGGSSSDRGCEVSENHVHEDNKFGILTGFVSTLPCSPRLDDDYGVYALDCEMVYTVAGSELARVTVVDFESKVVYDKLVKPESKIVDFNTRFSGIKKSDMEGVKTTIRDVQAVLLSMFNDKTILIGHSLENDLISLKLLHQSVVDTSVVFPHRLGPPKKRALRNLSLEILKKLIQQGVDGHDSKEDAATCMELMIHKVKEDVMKSMRYSRD